MSVLGTAQGKDTAAVGELYMAFELSDKKWKLVLSDGRAGRRAATRIAGDRAAVLQCVAKAKHAAALGGT